MPQVSMEFVGCEDELETETQMIEANLYYGSRWENS